MCRNADVKDIINVLLFPLETYLFHGSRATNPDHQFVKEELAAEHETAQPKHDELDLTI